MDYTEAEFTVQLSKKSLAEFPQDSTENLNGKIATIDGRQYVFIVMCH